MSTAQQTQSSQLLEHETNINDEIHRIRQSCQASDAYLRQKRDEFVEATEARLEVLNHELGRLDQRAREADGKIRDKWMMTRAELTRRRHLVCEYLQILKSLPISHWAKAARGIDDARQDLSAAIAHSREELQLAR
jgi:hypothetical protein